MQQSKVFVNQTRTQPKPTPPASNFGVSKVDVKPKKQRRRRRWLGLPVLLLLAGVGGWWLFYHPASDNNVATTAIQPPNNNDVSCVEQPKFLQNMHLTTSPAFSTSERGLKGLALLIPQAQGQSTTYQHPSWGNAGSLATLEFGRGGDLFVIPAPSINVLYNPADQQNQVYRVDSTTQEMARFVTLPRAAPPSDENPFGALGLGFDCQTNRLYVSSVAGSNRDQEVGRIYVVDVDKATVQTELDNVDPIGLAVFNGAKGKRLYYGLARYPEVWSIGLDERGNFVGQSRLEFSLANLGARGSDKARKLEFVQGNQMLVHGIEFSFNLIAPTEKQETAYRFKYEPTKDNWSQIKDKT